MAKFNNVRDELILNELLESFTTLDFIQIAFAFGVTKSTVKKRVIPRFIRKGFIDRIYHGQYLKIRK